MTRYVDGKPLDQKGRASVTVSSVGQVMENDEKCRWLEIKFTDKIRKGQDILKVLVAEKHLKPNGNLGNPMRHIIRGWQQSGNNEPVKIPKEEFGVTQMWFFPGRLNDVKELKPKVVEIKSGKLKCKGLTGRLQAGRGGATYQDIYEFRLHDKAPLGVVTGRMQQTVVRDGNVTFQLVVVAIPLKLFRKILRLISSSAQRQGLSAGPSLADAVRPPYLGKPSAARDRFAGYL